jgi:hypothetical protein
MMPSCVASPAAFANPSSGAAPIPTTMRSAAIVSLAAVSTASRPSGSSRSAVAAAPT